MSKANQRAESIAHNSAVGGRIGARQRAYLKAQAKIKNWSPERKQAERDKLTFVEA